MTRPRCHFYFDYVDPGSYLVDALLGPLAEDWGVELEHTPLELRPPPRPLVDPAEPGWTAYRREMEEAARRLDVPLLDPPLVPRSRKAHELALHAREKGCFDRAHEALFRAHFVEGRDIGRVDVLVDLAVALGLDRTETKAVLDVDRHLEALLRTRERALQEGIRGVPTIRMDGRTLEGLPSRADLVSFLAGS